MRLYTANFEILLTSLKAGVIQSQAQLNTLMRFKESGTQYQMDCIDYWLGLHDMRLSDSFREKQLLWLKKQFKKGVIAFREREIVEGCLLVYLVDFKDVSHRNEPVNIVPVFQVCTEQLRSFDYYIHNNHFNSAN